LPDAEHAAVAVFSGFRSRQQDRTVEVFPVGDVLAGTEWQPFIKTVIRVTRQTLLHSAATGLWGQRGEVAFYASSAAGFPATEMARARSFVWENRRLVRLTEL